MKTFVKTLISNVWVPTVRELYRRATDRAAKLRHAYGDTKNSAAPKCTVSYNKYGSYCIPESALHRPAARAVLSGKVHEPKTIDYMVTNCQSRDIIHAGTFFGDFLPALSGALASNALIWAFEPNWENFRCAEITLELNNVSNVRLAHVGLGAKPERLFVQTTDRRGQSLGGASRIVDEICSTELKEPVDIVAIDEAIPSERDIGILQLDIEGYEKEALTGALNTIRRCLPILILEVLPNNTLLQSDWFVENIDSLGYRHVAKLHRNFVYSCRSKQDRG